MMEDIEAEKVNCVAVKDLSRFGRDYIETGRYLERVFPSLGVRFISVSDGIDSGRQVYDMLVPIKNIFNEQYAKDISGKIQAAVRTKQQAGEFIGAFASYGYQKSPTDKNKLVIDEYAAEIVRKIFALYVQGVGKQRIARILNERGILCPSEYKRINGENYRNSHQGEKTAGWSYSTVNAILQNEVYAGNMVQGKKHQCMRGRQRLVERENWIKVEHTHEPVIDSDTWEKTQKLLGRKHSVSQSASQNVFAGLIQCGDCGSAMMRNCWQKGEGGSVYTLYCGTYKRKGKSYCSSHALPFSILEHIVLEDLRRIIKSAEHLQKIVKSQLIFCSGKQKTAGEKTARIKGELERAQKLKKSVYEDYKEGLVSREEFLAYREDYGQKEKFYERQIEIMEERQKDITTGERGGNLWVSRFVEGREIETLERGIVLEMVDQIVVYENCKIKICYNFTDDLGLFAQITSGTWRV